jgi:4-hydroxyphenylpyruvate dioxygenase-like putative hemolysin
MKNITWILILLFLFSCGEKTTKVPVQFTHVDQVIWVINDLDNTISHWENLGFTQVINLDTVRANLTKAGKTVKLKLARANLGGANITWIQPLEGESVFSEFNKSYGDGAMSLVHRLDNNKEALQDELKRLSGIGVKVKEEISIETAKEGNLYYVLMDTRDEGKYYLGYTCGNEDLQMIQGLSSENRLNLKINQYAFAIKNGNEKFVSAYWHKIGFPEFEINHPELGKKHYYGKPVNHDLIQGWQRQGDVSYEWCIPVTTPIVYDDHIKMHGEGIHHLAFTVEDMDKVLEDYKSKGYVVSMGGTWGEEGKPGSGRYEYIDLPNAGGVTMELLWSYE